MQYNQGPVRKPGQEHTHQQIYCERQSSLYVRVCDFFCVQEKESELEHLFLFFFPWDANDVLQITKMRSGWIKGSMLVLTVATALLYLSSIKREVHTHSERLQRAHHNDSIRGQGMLKRMAKMEADINRLREFRKFKYIEI